MFHKGHQPGFTMCGGTTLNRLRSTLKCIIDVVEWFDILFSRDMVTGNACQNWCIASPLMKWPHLIQSHKAQIAFHYV
jgi:hypothetical protein